MQFVLAWGNKRTKADFEVYKKQSLTQLSAYKIIPTNNFMLDVANPQGFEVLIYVLSDMLVIGFSDEYLVKSIDFALENINFWYEILDITLYFLYGDQSKELI